MLSQVYSCTHWRPKSDHIFCLGDDYTTKDLVFRFKASVFTPFSLTVFIGGEPEVNVRWPEPFDSVYITIKMGEVKCTISL